MSQQPAGKPTSHWYPTATQLADPASTQRALKQVLDQFYQLQDAHDKLQASHSALAAQLSVAQKQGGPGAEQPNGPANTKLLGLNVAPVDTNSLANGATLKYNKATGQFQFS